MKLNFLELRDPVQADRALAYVAKVTDAFIAMDASSPEKHTPESGVALIHALVEHLAVGIARAKKYGHMDTIDVIPLIDCINRAAHTPRV